MWNSTTILNRAREYASKYSDSYQELDEHYVRVAFEQFCLDTLAFPVEQSITTVANQREYTHSVVRVQRVIYDGSPLPILDSSATTGNYAIVYPSRIVLSFTPPAGKVVRVIGYGIPSNINSVVLEPAQQLMDAVAMLAASKYLFLYSDPQTQSRANTLLANYNAVVQQFRERYVDTVRVEDGGWSELGLLTRAREYARQYTERVNELDMHYIRGAFDQFCLDTLAFPVEQTITTVANQREYTHSVVRVQRVIYDGAPLPILDSGATDGNYAIVYPSRIALSFTPPAGKVIRIIGYGIPNNINSVVLEPAQQLMDAVAMLAAARYLTVYSDTGTQSRAGVLLANYQAIVQQFRERYTDSVRVEDGSWSELGLLARAREYAREYTERVNELDKHYVRDAFEQFCLDTLAFPTEQSITTTANQREYTHSVVRVQRVIYDGSPLPILDNSSATGNYAIVYPNRIVLSFNPPAGKVIRVIGYGIPSNINSVVLEPAGQLMACVAMLAASKYLMLSNDPNTQSRAGTLFANYQAIVQQFRERYTDSVRVEDGGWSELNLIARAREYARQYTERVNDLDNHYVRDAFEQFCLDTLAFPSEQSITTVANQREYTHSVVRVKRVIYDGVPLPILDNGATAGNYVVVHPNRIVLSFNPPAGRVIRVIGYGIPSNINSVVLEPAGQLTAGVAMLAASKYLMLSNDPNTQARATALLANYQAIVQQFRERYVDSVRVEDGGWSELSLLARAREYARRFTERVDGLDMHYVRGAFQQFCLDTNAFPAEHTVNTVGNQREYTHPLVRVNRVFLDGDELILLPEPNEYYRACAVYPNRIVLSFDPEPNQQLRIAGYYVPEIDTVYLEPAERLMSGIAMLSAYNYLIRFAEPQQLQSISLYQMEYRKIVDEFGARHLDGIRQRGGNTPVVGYISLT